MVEAALDVRRRRWRQLCKHERASPLHVRRRSTSDRDRTRLGRTPGHVLGFMASDAAPEGKKRRCERRADHVGRPSGEIAAARRGWIPNAKNKVQKGARKESTTVGADARNAADVLCGFTTTRRRTANAGLDERTHEPRDCRARKMRGCPSRKSWERKKTFHAMCRTMFLKDRGKRTCTKQ